MRRRDELGFSVIELMLIVVVLAIIIGVGALVFVRQKGGLHGSGRQVDVASQKADQTKPLLHNLGGIYLAAYNKTTGLAGDFAFNRNLINPTKDMEAAFTFFGQDEVLPGQVVRPSPSFGMRGIARQIELVSAIDGKVLYIKEQKSSKDYQLTLAKHENSTWFVVYDHVTDVRATRGQTVVAGQALGKAAPYIHGTYYYDLQVYQKDSPSGDIVEYVCPTTLLDEDVKPAYVEGLNLFARDWSDFLAKDVYGSQEGGCVKPSLRASEVVG